MKLYLAPQSSLELTRYLRSTNNEDGLVGTTMRKRRLVDAANTAQAVAELDETAQHWLSHAGKPIHALVPERAMRTNTKKLVTHLHGDAVPHAAFLDLGHGVALCSPNFLFMQMAMQLSFLDAVQLGMELCGTYSKWRLEPNIMGDPYYREHTESRACTFELPAAAALRHMNAFVERNKGQRGYTGAHAALRWVLEGSASPMETATYLLFCLPKRLGGYGLPKPVLNPKLIISNPDGTKVRYPDLFWPNANIDVEYNSDSEHSGEWSRYRDSKREVEFTVANIKVLPLTRQQLMNVDEFDSFAQGLRRMLHVRSRKPDPAWHAQRADLRRELLISWH